MPKTITDQYALSREDVRAIVDELPDMDLRGNDNDLGTFLLLLRAFTYADNTEREEMLGAAEEVLLPYSPSVNKALDALIQKQHQAIHYKK